jgi:hypothetical protein
MDNIKKCNKCSIDKTCNFFPKNRNTCKRCIADKEKERRANNKEKFREYKKQYRLKNLEKFKKESNIRGKAWYKKNKERVANYNKVLKLTPKRRYSRYKASAKARNINFFLTFDEFNLLTKQTCKYCKQYSRNVEHTGIDRIDSQGDYILNNCVPCCETCNIMKSDWTVEEFLSHIKIITEAQNDFRA